jgi:alpha-tubulin suppressor-like RCC1 family protein
VVRGWWYVVALIGSASLACRDLADPADLPRDLPASADGVESIRIQPGSGAPIVVGASVRLDVQVLDTAGNPLTGVALDWDTSDPAVATVSASGVVTAVGPGAFAVSARYSGDPRIDDAVMMDAVLRFTAIGTGASHTCGITADSAAFCWGLAASGQVGIPPVRERTTPVRASGNLGLITIDGGIEHTCATSAAGHAYCWGGNLQGQLGAGSLVLRTSAPMRVRGSQLFSSLGTNWLTVCGATAGGQAWCWGAGDAGGLGQGTQETPDDCFAANAFLSCSATPLAVSGGLSFTTIAGGGSHSCGLTADGRAWCWGVGSDGQLGTGDTVSTTTPQPVSRGGYVSLSVGVAGTCALDAAGRVFCWGLNDLGQLGREAPAFSLLPVQVPSIPPLSSVEVGRTVACGLAGTMAYCWGGNAHGQAGRGEASERSAPAPVTGDLAFGSLAVGAAHVCGLTTEGLMYCWGRNSSGQLGDGSMSASPVPVRVAGQ